MTAHRKLLADYATKDSEQAFAELVGRYINLVYSTAVRLVEGDTHRAEDVVQTVFADLAQRASTLSEDVLLGGWLHRRTCHVATDLMRRERRRQHRERQAAEMSALNDHAESSFEHIAPFLDEAINQLGAKDRTAIVLRFFEGQNLRLVGAALGSNEDAAQKRLARALDKLRSLLVRRGATLSGAGLAAVLATEAVTAAPAGLATSVTSAALASAATGSGITLTVLRLMAMTKLKVAVGAVIVAGVATTLVLEYQSLTQLREQNQALRQQVERLTREPEERQRPPNLVAQANNPASLRDELERLRREISALRRHTNEVAKLRAKNRELHAATGEPEDRAEAEFMDQTQKHQNELKVWGLDFLIFAHENNDRLPETWEQAFSVSQMRASIKDEAKFAAYMNFLTNTFEIVYRGNWSVVSNGGEMILFRENQARRSPQGEWVKVYGFVDGSTQVRSEPAEENWFIRKVPVWNGEGYRA